MEGKKRVMLAIDESECSHYALEWALNYLRDSIATPGSPQLVLFTAQPIANLSYIPAATYGSARMFTAMTAAPELIHSLQEHQRKAALALLERARELCDKHGVNAEAITEVGDPKEAICEAVEKYKVNLLILGSHGRGMFQRARKGTTKRESVRCCCCSKGSTFTFPAPPAMSCQALSTRQSRKRYARSCSNRAEAKPSNAIFVI